VKTAAEKAYDESWRAENRAYQCAYKRARYVEIAPAARVYALAYHAAHPAAAAARSLAWRQQHPAYDIERKRVWFAERGRELQQMRRAARRLDVQPAND